MRSVEAPLLARQDWLVMCVLLEKYLSNQDPLKY